jgi:glycosyltransferase involved in cell wall biosynthesis
MAKRRIALVIGSARPGGAEGQLVRLAAELSASGEDVLVLFTAYGGPLTTVLDDANVRWKVLRSLRPPTSTLRNLLAVAAMVWQLASFRPHVVFSWLAGTIWFTLPAAALVTRARRVAAFRGEVYDEDLRWTRRAFEYAVRNAHAVTINAPSLEAEARKRGADPCRIHLVPNGVQLPASVAVPDDAPPIAVVVANFRWYKGHDVLVAALTEVRSPLTVRLIGDGDLRAPTQNAARAQGVTDIVTFVDAPANVPAELAQAQFAIHPSRTEGLSNAILEQMAHGLPVVATDVGGTALLIDDGESGFLVPAGDAAALGAAIEKLASDPRLRVQMGSAARVKSERFAWATCTDSYQRLFTELCKVSR